MATIATTAFHGAGDHALGSRPRRVRASTESITALVAGLNDDQMAEPIVRSAYQPSRRSGPLAFIASAGAVLAMVAAIATMGLASRQHERQRLTAITLRDLDTKTKASPPPKTLEPEIASPSPVVIPKPAIELPSQGPKQMALEAPPPAVQISAPAIASVEAAARVSAPAAPASTPAREGGDLSGTVLVAKPPVYPAEARRRREQGTVKLLVLVDPEGRVADIQVAASSGSQLLDRAALRAVKHWRWTPAKQGGTATAVRGYVTIPFVLVSADDTST